MYFSIQLLSSSCVSVYAHWLCLSPLTGIPIFHNNLTQVNDSNNNYFQRLKNNLLLCRSNFLHANTIPMRLFGISIKSKKKERNVWSATHSIGQLTTKQMLSVVFFFTICYVLFFSSRLLFVRFRVWHGTYGILVHFQSYGPCALHFILLLVCICDCSLNSTVVARSQLELKRSC